MLADEKGESGDCIKGRTVKEGSQLVEFINFREVKVEINGRLVSVPEMVPPHRISTVLG